MGEPKFGDWLRGIHASESNPQRDGMYVRTIHTPRGRVNAGKSYELTDGEGGFWRYPAGSVERITRPAPSEAEVEAAAIAICAVNNSITADGARYEWPNMTDHAKDRYLRMARAALGVE